MKKIKLAGLFLGILLIAAACNKTAVSTTPTPTPTPTPSQTLTPPPVTPTPSSSQSGEVKVTISGGKFSPSPVTVKKGTKVTFTNTDSSPRWPASNPHPTHTDLPGFDAEKGLKQNESYSFTFNQVGTWKYHDHLFPSNGGTVIVTE